MSSVEDVLISTGYRLAWRVICRVPESWARWAFDTATSIAWRRQGPGVQKLENNLLRVLGPEALLARLDIRRAGPRQRRAAAAAAEGDVPGAGGALRQDGGEADADRA